MVYSSKKDRYGGLMNNMNLETVYIKDTISRCEDINELKETIWPMMHTQQDEWAKKITEVISDSGCTKTKFAELCEVSRVTVDKWCKGAIPKNRETFLKIGMAAGYDIDRMNQLLQRYGRYPALYSKSLEDCICKFVISQDFGNDALSKYKYILGRIKSQIIRDDSAEYNEDVSTVKFDERLSAVRDEDELETFITENISVFANAYHKFYAYVKMMISANYLENLYSNVYELSLAQGWSSSLRQCVSAIKTNKWYPTRNKIISLGLHLSMDHDQIDEMLELAHMEPLCAKNIFESVIMFILDDASLQNILDSESESYEPEELCKYARKILGELELPEIEEFISELPEVDEEDEY